MSHTEDPVVPLSPPFTFCCLLLSVLQDDCDLSMILGFLGLKFKVSKHVIFTHYMKQFLIHTSSFK